MKKKESYTQKGKENEEYIKDNYDCPYCENDLELFAKSNKPIYDVRCSNCLFMAQIKLYNHDSYDKVKKKPSHQILSSTYDIFKKVLNAGIIPPSLIIRYQDNKVVFYPYIIERKDENETNILKRKKLVKKQRYFNYKIYKHTPRVLLKKKKSK